MVLDWAKDWVMDKVYGVAKTGIQAGGSMAGNAVGGVGTFIEESGRGAGQSIAGAIGGVGSYINSYGQSIIDSTAASGVGGDGGEKKHAVKPRPSVSKAVLGRQRRVSKPLSAGVDTGNSVPSSARKTLPATGVATRVGMSSASKASVSTPARVSPSPKQLTQQGSRPGRPGAKHNLPSSRSVQHARKAAGTTTAAPTSTRTAEAMTKGSSAIRRPLTALNKPGCTSTGSISPKTVQGLPSNGAGKGLRKPSAGGRDRAAARSDGKVRISRESRPRR